MEPESEEAEDKMSNFALLTRIKKQDAIIVILIALIVALYEIFPV